MFRHEDLRMFGLKIKIYYFQPFEVVDRGSEMIENLN